MALLSDYTGGSGLAVVRSPDLTSPSNSATDQAISITLTATEYSPAYSVDNRDYRQFQVDLSTGDWSSPVIDQQVATDTLGIEVDPSTTYKWRCRDVSVVGDVSKWSEEWTFTTGAYYVNQPSITSPTNGATEIGEQPVLMSSAFASTPGGYYTHESSQWQIATDSGFGTIIWDSGVDTTNLESIEVPSGNLLEGTTYYVRVRHTGNGGVNSSWSTTVSFTTTNFFVFGPENAGEPLEGGYYAGANIVVGGTTYALIVAPISQGGENGSIQWKTTRTSTSGTSSTNDGQANTAAMIAGGASVHPAANFCNGLSINGYTDWHLPSIDELEICYRYLKPTTLSTSVDSTNPHGTATQSNPNSDPVLPSGDYSSSYPAQTSVAIFQEGGSEAFWPGAYWSSTEYSSIGAWTQEFYNGNQYYLSKDYSYRARAVRWVAI